MDSLKPKLRCGVAALAMMACCGGVAAADDDLPGLDEAAAEGGVKTGGVVQFDLARTYGGKDHWSMARARADVSATGGDSVKWKVSGRAHSDAVVGIENVMRRLKEEGQGYQQLLDAELERQARIHLQDPRHTAESLALALGYHDLSGFRRAFKRWFGMSLREYQAQQAAP